MCKYHCAKWIGTPEYFTINDFNRSRHFDLDKLIQKWKPVKHLKTAVSWKNTFLEWTAAEEGLVVDDLDRSRNFDPDNFIARLQSRKHFEAADHWKNNFLE
jgi:hypothetical protein